MCPSAMDDNGPSRVVWLARQQSFLLVREEQPRGFSDLMNGSTNTLSECQNSETNTSHSFTLSSVEQTRRPNPVCWWNFPATTDRGEQKPRRNASAADLFLREWTDRTPVRTSSYLRGGGGVHWRGLRGEKVTQVTGEAKCLDCVRGPLAMRRSFTLPCRSWSQLHWMRPAGTAPLSDNCSSGLCPGVPLTPSSLGRSRAPGLINHTYNTALRCRQGAVNSFHNLRSNCALQHSHS